LKLVHHVLQDDFLQKIRERLLLSQDIMKSNADKKRRGKEFVIGDWVWLQLQPDQQPRLRHSSHKVIFTILTKAHIHDVFHVTLLKKFEGNPPDVVVPLPSIHHGRVLPVPNKILYARLNRGTCEVLVSWQHWPPIETTWENVDPFKLTYPDI
jgi:hypothetical protein